MSTLYRMACSALARFDSDDRLTPIMADRIRERWELVYSQHLERWGNPEREEWEYVERADDWFPNTHTFCCENCSNIELSDDSQSVLIFTHGRERTHYWCESCSDRHASTCDQCGERVRDTDMMGDDNGLYCPPCYEELEAERERERDSVGEYHGTTRPYPPRDQPAWSIELEMELPDERSRESFAIEARAIADWQGNALILERDGSLCSSKGVECILSCYTNTRELLADVHALQAVARRWKAIAWDLPKLRDREAGLHISTNRVDWDHRALCRLAYILTVCAPELEKAAGRKSTFAEFPPRLDAGYLGNYKPLREFANGRRGKYSAVNLRDTRLEWRIFRSTLSPERISRNLEMVNALEHLAKSPTPARDLKSTARQIISTHTL